MNRRLRIALTLVVSGLAFTYLVVKIDVHETARIIRDASPLWVATSICVILMMVFPMAWRWGLLLRAREISERFAWLLRAYFVSLAVGQLLPTSVGGDASRIYEATRRHRGQGATIAASVLVERALGGTVTLLLAAVGFLLAIGRYPIGAYLWIELVLVVGAVVLGFVFFSKTARARLGFAVPLARKLRVESLARSIYEGIHSYRDRLARSESSRWRPLSCRSVAFSRSTQPDGRSASRSALLAYVVLGPLLFLVTLLPFTDQRTGRARGLLRPLLCEAGSPRRRCFRLRLPLLHDVARADAPRARHRSPRGSATNCRRPTPRSDRFMTALLATLGLFLMWCGIGLAALVALRADLGEFRVVLTAPILGTALTVVPLFVVSNAGVSMDTGAPPVLVGLLLASLSILGIRRPHLPLAAVPVFILSLVELFLVGRPMLEFGFDWVASANGDMAYYVLSAPHLRGHGLQSAVDFKALADNRDFATAAQELNLRGLRPGTQITLASLELGTGDRP